LLCIAGYQAEERLPTDAGHMVNIGTMIEEMEGKLRNSLDQVNERIKSALMIH
jgi:hypothetical protein